MILYDMKAFYRWLESCSDAELITRRDKAVSAETMLTDTSVRTELRRLVRLIEEEMVSRKL